MMILRQTSSGDWFPLYRPIFEKQGCRKVYDKLGYTKVFHRNAIPTHYPASESLNDLLELPHTNPTHLIFPMAPAVPTSVTWLNAGTCQYEDRCHFSHERTNAILKISKWFYFNPACSPLLQYVQVSVKLKTLIAIPKPIASPLIRSPTEQLLEQKARKTRHSTRHKGRKIVPKGAKFLSKFEVSQIQKPTNPTEIKGFTFVASYNWSNSDEPVIFVPGTFIAISYSSSF